jgi:hypothetical protein
LCITPDFIVDLYDMAFTVQIMGNTTGKMAPKNGSTSCDVTW